MKLIVNTEEKKHLHSLQEMFQKCSGNIIIASPYLASDMKKFLSQFDFQNITSIILITSFKPNDFEQYTKPFQLRDFFCFFEQNYLKLFSEKRVTLHINNDLHGKIYIASNSMLLTSANFTCNGLKKNHEFGISIEDETKINIIKEQLLNPENLDHSDISYSQIKDAVRYAQTYQNQYPLQKQELPKFNGILETITNINNPNPQYFLKPIGDSESPILLKSEEDFSAIKQDIRFAKKPKNIRKGDIIIAFGTGSRALLSYFYVTTGNVQEFSLEERKVYADKERWPFFMDGCNQSPNFGRQWYKHNLHQKMLLEEFQYHNPNIAITVAGGDNLNTFQRGSDKVRITKEFGDFLISKIKECM